MNEKLAQQLWQMFHPFRLRSESGSMAPAVDQLAAPVARTIVPSAWLFALTGSLLLGQLVAAAEVILSAGLLFFFFIPLVLLINPALQ